MTELPLLRQSERAAFKRCQWAWYQSYVLGLQPIIEKHMELAEFGTLVHVCLAEYYLPGIQRGPHPAETWQRVAGEVRTKVRTEASNDDELVAKWEDFYTLGTELLVAYELRYQGDPHWDVIDAERRFSVLIPDVRVPRLKSAKGRRVYTPIVRLVGTIDLCFRDLNQEDNKHRPLVKMVDHKTMTRIETAHLTLDEQPSTYIAVGTHALQAQGLIEKDQVIAGMEWNIIKRAKLDTRPRDERGMARNKPTKKHYIDALTSCLDTDYVESDRTDLMKWKLDALEHEALLYCGPVYGDVSADQSGQNFLRYFVPRTAKERQRQIVRISEEARVMDDVRAGRLPVLKTPTHQCPYCKYFDLCELDESGGDVDYFIETTMKKHDPYEDHREGASNSKFLPKDGG